VRRVSQVDDRTLKEYGLDAQPCIEPYSCEGGNVPPGRRVIVSGAAIAMFALILPARASADDTELVQAVQFIRESGNRLAALAHGNPSIEEKNDRLRGFLDDVVDVDGVARFCLGRFWRTATPSQQHDYLSLFRQVLVNRIGPRINDYPEGGMQVVVKPAVRNGSVIEVPTLVERTADSNTPVRVTWVIGTDTGRLRIVDIVSEGMSLRLTQRSDYNAFLSHNNGDLDTLLQALRQQAATQ
jgi:phospholipid transport system substrate-binding protein